MLIKTNYEVIEGTTYKIDSHVFFTYIGKRYLLGFELPFSKTKACCRLLSDNSPLICFDLDSGKNHYQSRKYDALTKQLIGLGATK